MGTSQTSIPEGPRNWIVAIGAALAAGTGFGIIYSFGTLLEEISKDLTGTRGTTALIFGITVALFYGSGVFSGPISDRIGPRPLLLAGGVLVVVGLLLTSHARNFPMVYASYGIGVGLGGGLIVTPAYACTGQWFDRRRTMAMALIGIGIGIGTLVLGPVSGWLVESYGWRVACRWIAVGSIVPFAAGFAAVSRPPIRTDSKTSTGQRKLMKDRVFLIIFFSSLFYAIALFAVLGFVVDIVTGNGVSPRAASLLIGIVGASSIAGRVLIGLTSNRFSIVRAKQVCMALISTSILIWLLSGGNFAALAVFAAVLGIAYGGYVSVSPAVVAYLFGTEGLGGTIGLTFLGAGIGGLIGPPFAGWLIDTSGRPYAAQLMALSASLIAVALVLGLPQKPQSTAS